MSEIWTGLPVELEYMILSFLNPLELIIFGQVSRRAAALIRSNQLCQTLLQRYYPLAAARLQCEVADRGSQSTPFEILHASTAVYTRVLNRECLEVRKYGPDPPFNGRPLIYSLSSPVSFDYGRFLLYRSHLHWKSLLLHDPRFAKYTRIGIADYKAIRIAEDDTFIAARMKEFGLFVLLWRRRAYCVLEMDLSGNVLQEISLPQNILPELLDEQRGYRCHFSIHANDTHVAIVHDLAMSSGGSCIVLRHSPRQHPDHGRSERLEGDAFRTRTTALDDHRLYFLNSELGTVTSIDLSSGTPPQTTVKLCTDDAYIYALNGHAYFVSARGIFFLSRPKSAFTSNVSRDKYSPPFTPSPLNRSYDDQNYIDDEHAILPDSGASIMWHRFHDGLDPGVFGYVPDYELAGKVLDCGRIKCGVINKPPPITREDLTTDPKDFRPHIIWSDNQWTIVVLTDCVICLRWS